MTDNLTNEQRRKNMQAIKSKETKLELLVTNALWNQGIRFRKNVKNLMGKPDIAIKKYKVVIFIDSCFWHGCEEHGNWPKTNEHYWISKIIKNKKRDIEVFNYYNSIGWNILRIWEHQFREDFNGTVQNIIDFINTTKCMIK